MNDYLQIFIILPKLQTTKRQHKEFWFFWRWHKVGNKVIFASERPVKMLKLSSYKDELEPDYFISNNGLLIYDRDLKIFGEVYITSDRKKRF